EAGPVPDGLELLRLPVPHLTPHVVRGVDYRARDVDEASLRTERRRRPRVSALCPRGENDRLVPVWREDAAALDARRDAIGFGARRNERVADRKWLRRRRLHPPLDADRFLRDADERFPRDAIEDVEEPGLAGVHEDLARPTAIGDVGEQRRRARVVIPHVVLHFLRVPPVRAGPGLTSYAPICPRTPTSPPAMPMYTSPSQYTGAALVKARG